MADEVKWILTIDETGAIKRMEEFRKSAESTDKSMEKTKKGSKEASLSIKSLGSSFGGLKGLMAAGAGAIGLGGLAFGLKDIVSKTMEANESAEHFGAMTGMNTKNSMYYTAALKAHGLSGEQFGRMYKTFAKNLQTAERQQYSFAVGQEKARMQGKLYTSQVGVQAEALQKLGISYSTLKALSPEQQFQMISRKLEGMNQGLEKTTIMSDLMGRGATQFATWFEKGALSGQSYLKMAREFFPVVSGGKKGQEELIAEQQKSSLAWEGLQVTLGEKVAPALTHVYGDFSKLIGSIEKGHGIWGTLEHDLGGVFNDIKDVVTWLGHSKAVVDLLMPALGLLAGAWATEKVLAFGKALGGLTMLSWLPREAKALAASIGLIGSAEEEAAGVAVPPILTALITAYAAYKAMHALFAPQNSSKGPNEGGGSPAQSIIKHATGKQIYATGAEQARAAIYGSTGFRIEHGHPESYGPHGWEPAGVPANPQATGKPAPITFVGALERALQGTLASERPSSETHVHLHIDGKELAQAVAINPHAVRYLAEGSERGSLQRAARR